MDIVGRAPVEGRFAAAEYTKWVKMKLFWLLLAATTSYTAAAVNITKSVSFEYGFDAAIVPIYDIEHAAYIGDIAGLPVSATVNRTYTSNSPFVEVRFAYSNLTYNNIAGEPLLSGEFGPWKCNWYLGSPVRGYLSLTNSDIHINTGDSTYGTSFTVNTDAPATGLEAHVWFDTQSLPSAYLRDDIAQIGCTASATYRSRNNELPTSLSFYTSIPVIAPTNFTVTPAFAQVNADKSGTFKLNFTITDIPREGRIVITSNTELTLAGSKGNEWLIDIRSRSDLPLNTNKLTITSRINGVSLAPGVKQYTLNFTRHYY
ncbi:hypothetical protein QPJ24_004818 [Escherichia coli]|nr:hypothetical protein [Escherichia coli]